MESERDDVRQSVRGEFSTALESLSSERSALLDELSSLRLRLAEAASEREAAEREAKRETEEQVQRIHERLLLLITLSRLVVQLISSQLSLSIYFKTFIDVIIVVIQGEDGDREEG